MDFFKLATIFLIIAATSFSALAAEEETNLDQSQTKAKASDVSDQFNTTPGAEVVDDLITNNNLRALSGSLSRWSIASQFNYNGGTVQDPFSQDRPNISDASGNTIKADLDGAISTKYNIDGKNSLMAGIGMRWIAPMAMGNLNNYAGTPFDVMNPYLQYQYVYKWLGIQSVMQVQGMLWTQADYTAIGYAGQFSVDQENMYQIGKSHLSIGVSSVAQYNLFNQSGPYLPAGSSTPIDLSTVQSVWAFDFAPILEYQITPKINFRTLVNVFYYEHYANFSSPTALFHDAIYQSIGVGLSITRDVFLYPNVQFLPGNMAANLTNVGVAATINVF